MIRIAARWFRGLLPTEVREQIGRAGRFFTSTPQFPSIEGGLLCLKQRGFSPSFAVDVGAYHGDWTVLFKNLFPSCAVLMLEAQETKCAQLNSVCTRLGASVEYRIALLGPAVGQPVKFVEMEMGSSVLEEHSPYARSYSERTTDTVDHLLEADSRSVDFLKLDVQGYELEVLRGATRSLGQARGVLMEASLMSVNRGAPLIAEVVQFMDSHGFRLVDFCSQIRRKDGVLWQTDLLFVRVDSGLLPDPALTHENWA